MDKPILFSGEMVRAILEGKKTQTRRVVNFVCGDSAANIQAHEDWASVVKNKDDSFTFFDCVGPKKYSSDAIWHDKGFSPYGKVGDGLWVRETWQRVYERADGQRFTEPFVGAEKSWVEYAATPRDEHEPPRWRPSIFMPRNYCRINLEITGVRVQRVQDISRDDAKAEGVSNVWSWDGKRNAKHPDHFRRALLNPYIANYSVLWNEINAERGFGWDVNPWVWVVEFKKVEMT